MDGCYIKPTMCDSISVLATANEIALCSAPDFFSVFKTKAYESEASTVCWKLIQKHLPMLVLQSGLGTLNNDKNMAMRMKPHDSINW